MLITFVTILLGTDGKPKEEKKLLDSKNQCFSYSEVVSITDNFQKVLGKGGFGAVYSGHLKDGTQVAVKMLSPSSAQGSKQFRTEASFFALAFKLFWFLTTVSISYISLNLDIFGCSSEQQAQLLARVHHRNLASLVGYCDEGSNMGLIYEYMANGNLEELLSGIYQYLYHTLCKVLNFREIISFVVYFSSDRHRLTEYLINWKYN